MFERPRGEVTRQIPTRPTSLEQQLPTQGFSSGEIHERRSKKARAFRTKQLGSDSFFCKKKEKKSEAGKCMAIARSAYFPSQPEVGEESLCVNAFTESASSPSLSSRCKLHIVTTDSVSPHLLLPRPRIGQSECRSPWARAWRASCLLCAMERGTMRSREVRGTKHNPKDGLIRH